MGRRRKDATPVKKENHARYYNFVGGPWHGRSERMFYPPMKRIRFAFPEWCDYENEDGTLTYHYVEAANDA